MARILQTAGNDVLRDGHWVYNPATGVIERSTLLEAQSTNLCVQSENFGSAPWTTLGITTRTAAAIPASVMGVDLDLLGDADASAGAYFRQTISFTGDGTKAVSIFMRKGPNSAAAGSRILLRDGTAAAARIQADVTWSASGVPTATTTVGGVQGTPREIANGIYRIQFIAPGVVAGNTNELRVYPADAATAGTQGDVYAGGVQVENGPVCTSYVKTTTAAVTRSADNAYIELPGYLTTPQALTLYVKIIEQGSSVVTGTPLLSISNAAGVAPMVYVHTASGAGYRGAHYNGTTTVNSTPATTPSVGDQVELRVSIDSSGSITVEQSINGAASTTGPASAPLAFAGAWSGTRLYLNSLGTIATGYNAFLSVKLDAGVQTMDYMRALKAA